MEQTLNHRLHFACLIGNIDEVIKSLQEGANVNSIGLYGELTPLLTAITHGYTAIVKILLENGAQTELSCEGYTPLALACSAGNVEIARLLVEHGAHIEARDREGHTPLLQAALEGKVDAIKYLLLIGADRHATNYNCETAEQLALKKEHRSLAEFLKKVCNH